MFHTRNRPGPVYVLVGITLVAFLGGAGCATAARGAEWTQTSIASPLQGGLEASREIIGPFVVVVERDTVRFRGPHVPVGWTRVHLMFTTPDDRVNVSVTDNGRALVVNAQTSTSCYFTAVYHQFREDGSHLYAALAEALDEIVTCPRGMEAARRYQRMFRRAEGHFPAAMRAMMGRANAVYNGRLERCEGPTDPRDDDAWMALAQRCL